MGIGPLAGIAGHYLESLFAGPLTGSSKATPAPGITAGGSAAADQSSPFTQVLDSVQEMAQSGYQNVTQQISGKLHSVAQSTAANGNTGLSEELTKLSGEFSNASVNWQLPNLNTLAQSIGY